MPIVEEVFFTRDIFDGCLLGSIAHAVFTARAPHLSHEQSWEGRNYNVQNSAGSRGTVSFGQSDDEFVAAFYYEDSSRNPLRLSENPSSLTNYLFTTMPRQHQLLAQEVTQYLLQDVGASPQPVITSAFWSDRESGMVVANEAWPEVFSHGACLIEIQLLPRQSAIHRWRKEFALTDDEVNTVLILFERRRSEGTSMVEIQPEQVELLRAIADGEEGMAACRESFEEIGFRIPI